MAINLNALLHLQAKGLLRPGAARLLDIGPQNVYFASEAQIRAFVRHQGQRVADDALASEIARLVYFSTPRAGERTTFLSEITDLTPIVYSSIDVAPGLKTTILDLKFDRLPARMRGAFDLVLNFGTSEHIVNQWNCFAAMHEAAAVGGVLYSQIPTAGYLDHGYFCATPFFFKDLAAANGYEIADLFLHHAGWNDLAAMGLDVRSDAAYGVANSNPDGAMRVPCFNVNAILRKTRVAPFRCQLETATAHAIVSPWKAWRYGKGSARAARG
jgi:hypothetical protein